MVKDISNKTLATLLIVAIAISLLGTLVSLNKLGGLGITGAASDTSTAGANVTITSSTSITFANASIDFASGYVTAGSDHCIVDTLGTAASGCTTIKSMPSGFILENTGNVYVYVNLTNQKTAAEFLDGSNPCYQYNVTENEASSCTTAPTGTWDSNISSALAATNQICDQLNYTVNKNSLAIDIRLCIPADTTAGDKTDMFTATAISL